MDRGSKETLNDAVDAADRANVTIYTIYFKGEQESGIELWLSGWPARRHGGGYPGGGGGYPGGGGGYPGGGGAAARRWRSEAGGRRQEDHGADCRRAPAARYFEAKKKDNLEDIYEQIAEELRGQYLLTYTPDKVDNDGGYHKIALKANKDDLIVVTREGLLRAGRGDSK